MDAEVLYADPRRVACPVPDVEAVDLRRLRLAHLTLGESWFHVRDRAYPPPAFNTSARGDTRFAPFADVGNQHLAGRQTVALLETVFRDLHELADRIVYTVTALDGRQLSQVHVTERLPLIDLREPPASEVVVLYHPSTPSGALTATVALVDELTSGHGWLLVAEAAELLGAETDARGRCCTSHPEARRGQPSPSPRPDRSASSRSSTSSS